MKLVSVFLQVIVLLFVLLGVNSLSWKQSNPTPSAAIISPVAFGNGVMVTFGHYSYRIQALVSKDLGVTWEEVPLDQTGFISPPTPAFYFVTFREKIGFLAVPTPLLGAGESPGPASIITSTDGITWSHVNGSIWFGGVLASNGNVVVTAGGTPVYSTQDGLVWTKQTDYNLIAGTVFLKSLDTFLIFGYDPHDLILSSKTGQNFKPYLNFTEVLGTEIIDVFNIIESDDGLVALLQGNNLDLITAFCPTGGSWKIVESTMQGTYGQLSYLNKVYCLSTYESRGPSILYTSGPSSNWKYSPTKNGNSFAVGVPGANVWIGTSPGSFTNGLIQRSTDGITWETYNNGIIDPITSFFYTNEIKQLVLGTTSTIYLGNDGNSWKPLTFSASLFYEPVSNTILGLNENLIITKDFVNLETIPLPVVPNTSRWSSATFDVIKGVIYVACSWYKGFLQQGIVYSRTLKNTTWNSAILAKPEVYTTGKIVSGNGATVVQGNGFDGIRLFTSSDGVSWKQTLFLDAGECSLVFIGPDGDKRFFTTCGIMDGYMSTDGYNWELISGATNIFGISYVDQWGFIAGTAGGYVQSEDGKNFGKGEKITDRVTPFDLFACGTNCAMVSSYDNSIFVTSQLLTTLH